MKNNRGISVLALVITVVVIIIIASITTYTGVNMIADARKKAAEDKLSVIADALRRTDSVLRDISSETELEEEDFAALDLRDYYDDNYSVKVSKNVTVNDEKSQETYTLKMYKKADGSEYVKKDYTVIENFDKKIYTVSFDETKGVNRPMLSSKMTALSMDGSSNVNDVLTDNWYDYTSNTTSFAKMKYNGGSSVYVWIPRFAYSIQTYYDGSLAPNRAFSDVPATAIKIAFLRETSDYMGNNEVLPDEYAVHPAFSSGDEELAGFWISYESLGTASSFANAISSANNVVANDDSASTSHLMSNSEYGAALYLMYALNDFEEIDFTKNNEYVAAGAENTLGDAMIETNWDRITANYPTTEKPCIVRLMKSSYFDFTNVATSGGNYSYRAVIVNK